MKYEHNVGLIWGIPTLFRPTTLQWALAFKALNPPINFNTQMSIIPNERVDVARNMIVEQALKAKAKYIFFQDDDTCPPPHALRQLIMRMENTPQAGVVGGIYFTKSNPAAPLVFRGNGAGSYWDWKVGEYFEVSGIGMGCTLIRTEIFEALPKPWFKTVDTDSYDEGINHAEQWTEDLYFCKQVLEHTPWQIYADAGILCEHHDAISQRKWGLEAGTLPTRKLPKDPNKLQILDIGCGPDRNKIPESLGEVTRVDIQEDCNPDYRCDARFLPFGDNVYDYVFSSHVLEHFAKEETFSTLKEWVRVLKPGGEIWLILPNIKWAAQQIVEGTISIDVMNVLYGGQSDAYDFHKTGFTPQLVMDALRSLGCDPELDSEWGYNMKIVGKKNEI